MFLNTIGVQIDIQILLIHLCLSKFLKDTASIKIKNNEFSNLSANIYITVMNCFIWV